MPEEELQLTNGEQDPAASTTTALMTTEIEPTDPEVTAPVITDTHEPPETSKRWKDIYWKMNENQRLFDEEKARTEALQEHNKKLEQRLDAVEGVVSETARPDPVQDPEAYEQWLSDKIERKYEQKERERELNQVTQQINQPAQTTQTPEVDTIRAQQIAAMEAQHGTDEYNAMMMYIQNDVSTDPILRNEILQSGNPPQAAYEYAVKKRNQKIKTRTEREQRSFAEDGSPAPVEQKLDLTDAEKRAANAMGIPLEDYMKQKKYIAGVP